MQSPTKVGRFFLRKEYMGILERAVDLSEILEEKIRQKEDQKVPGSIVRFTGCEQDVIFLERTSPGISPKRAPRVHFIGFIDHEKKARYVQVPDGISPRDFVTQARQLARNAPTIELQTRRR